MLAEEYKQRVLEAIRRADDNDSNINPGDVTRPDHKTHFKGVYSMDEPHYFHVLNNLCSYEDVVHTHIGFFNGGSLFAALEGNSPKQVFAVDSFFGGVGGPEREEEFERVSLELGYTERYKLINADCFTFDLSLIDEPVNFHLYDAHHEEWAQYEGIKRFEPTFADTVIIMVDNFGSEHVKRASDKAVEDMDYRLHFKTVIERHCHQGIYVITKE